MKLKLILALFIVSLLTLGCERRCETKAFYLKMNYWNESGHNFRPEFNRVYSTYVEGNYAFNSAVDSIPIDLSRDSTILIFEFEDRIDTLAFRYDRELNVGKKNSGYCIEIYNEEVLETTTFEFVSVVFEYAGSLGSRNRSYKANIHF